MKPELREEYYEDGSLQFQEWCLNEKLHREDGPAIIWYYKDGSIRCQDWCLNGKFHREDGPARINYYEDSSVECQHWFLNGTYHREDGPVFIEYYPNGSVKHRSWWINDKPLFKRDFTSLDMIKRMDAFPLFTAKEIARLKLDEPI